MMYNDMSYAQYIRLLIRQYHYEIAISEIIGIPFSFDKGETTTHQRMLDVGLLN